MKKTKNWRLGVLVAAAIVVVGVGMHPAVDAAPRKPTAKKVKRAPVKSAPRPALPQAEPVEQEPAEATPAAVTDEQPAAAAPSPEPNPEPANEAPAHTGPDLSGLRAEYDALKDALFRSRARRETLERALLSTQLAAQVLWDGSRHFRLQRVELRMDGIRIWEANEGLTGDKPVVIAPKSAAPGPHVLTVRAEVRPRDNPKLGYVSEQSFSLVLTEGKKTSVEITIDESGDLPSYNPEIELEVSE